MSDVTTQKCNADGCGALKNEGNKWWIILQQALALIVTTPEKMDDFVAGPFDREGFLRLDYCSEECLLKGIGKWTSKAHAN